MAPHRALVAALLAVALPLAGCTTEPPENDDETGSGPLLPGPTDPGAREAAAGNLPFWFPGLTFRFEVEHAGLAAPGEVAVTVQQGETDQHRLLATGDEDATHWSLYWGLPPIGAVSVAHLDPIRDGNTLGWFSFPLADGKRWNGEDLDGTALEFIAERTTARLVDGTESPAYEVVATNEGAARLGYTYAAEAGWFTTMWRDLDASGAVDARATLVSLAVERELRDEQTVAASWLLHAVAMGPGAEVPPGVPPVLEPALLVQFTIPEDALTLLVVHRFEGGAGLYRTLIRFSDESRTETEWVNDGSETSMMDLGAIEPVAGDADALVLVFAADATATLTVLALVPAS